MIAFDAPYRTRPIRFLGRWEIGDWRLKAYSIAYDRESPRSVLVDAALKTVRERLALSGADTAHYSVGFAGVHEGKTGNFVFVSWWADENELHHHVYTSSSETPEKLVYATPTGLVACTWDLRVLCHERDAWTESVLKRYPQPDIEGYLENTLDVDL